VVAHNNTATAMIIILTTTTMQPLEATAGGGRAWCKELPTSFISTNARLPNSDNA